MCFLEQQYQNEFLAKWIYGELTAKEHTTFVSSNLYKNLVLSTMSKKDFIKENS